MKKGWFGSRADAERQRTGDAEGSRQSKERGTRVADRYVLGRSVGRGGMATVYLATDTLLNRPVALKMLRHELAHSAAMDRFTREIGVVSHLRHAHIVPLHDSGIYEGLPFYVMAYIEGESLHERLKRDRKIAPAEVARIGAEVAEALAYAHREGVLHRDITPGNILLADGNAHLADFGIARVFQDTGRARTTASGFVLGTPTYMSPEQASGELDYDGRSDIYSLGCVLYEACAGEPPFRGPTPQAVIAARFGPPPPALDTVRKGVPPLLAAAIARAMALAPEHRFTDAADLAAELRVAAPADSPRRSSSSEPRWRLRVAIGIVLLACAFVAGYLVATR
jgi:serine/threonine-protein kinase